MPPERTTTEGVEATLHVVAAQRVARSTVTGFGLCEESGHPLSDGQKVSLLTAAMLELEGMRDEIDGVVRVERLIAELRGFDRS
jgi:hypothetical protein